MVTWATAVLKMTWRPNAHEFCRVSQEACGKEVGGTCGSVV